MTLHPLEEHVIFGPDAYDLLNKVEVGYYDQAHYIEKEGLHISFIPEDDEEESADEEPEDNFPQKDTNDNLSSSSSTPVASSGTFDNLVTISFTHPLPSLGITLKGLARLSTPKCRIDHVDQSSTLVIVDPLKTPFASLTVNPSTLAHNHPLGQGGATI